MQASLTPQQATLNKEEFTKAVTELMRMVARSRASSITFSSSEIVTFINHLYEYVAGLYAGGEVDVEKLTRALIDTRGKYASLQDQAVAIKALL
jgi:hypothetical protein